MPRVNSFAPRVVSIAPQQTAPNAFTVNSDVLFAFDASDLSPDAQAVLASVVQQLRTAKPGATAIVGYTDSIGDPNYNIGLSQRRAASVQAYLQPNVNNAGLTYNTQGLGAADPVAPNTLPNGGDNPAGRQQNRRVVITYTPS
ncbi:MAG: OmpA family protein [Actinomycetota bacterium]|nr:OmpA family protein [Actinomycetota bacterium]